MSTDAIVFPATLYVSVWHSLSSPEPARFIQDCPSAISALEFVARVSVAGHPVLAIVSHEEDLRFMIAPSTALRYPEPNIVDLIVLDQRVMRWIVRVSARAAYLTRLDMELSAIELPAYLPQAARDPVVREASIELERRNRLHRRE
jgi:hypothetical protein